MMKLWSKDITETSEQIEKFTVGRDNEFDTLLAEHDVTGTIAHVSMLQQAGLMDAKEAELALNGLKQILEEIRINTFSIEEGVEDIHSQVELLLTRRIGDAGKKIHSGRSRNDQIAVDIKLFLRGEILKIKDEVKSLFDLLITQSEKNKDKLLPGYTHLQIAMPSSAGLWLGAYAESLVDDMELLVSAYIIANKNPLGSGAGYGSSFPLNRSLTTQLLGFRSMNYNSVYAQMSRGKTEKIVSQALASIAATLSKLAMDCCLYLNQNFGFISFPAELTTGSSIMPHKKNPDVFELVRAHCNRIQAIPNELTILLNNLPSGYHRDLQLTKEVLFPAFNELRSCLLMTGMMISNITINENILNDEKYRYLFSVEAVNDLVNKGVPFREAYKTIGDQIDKGEFIYDFSKGLHHTHEGSIGNLKNDAIINEMDKVLKKF
jgi:argininosuccinate lyase